jgi:hypothetical protein
LRTFAAAFATAAASGPAGATASDARSRTKDLLRLARFFLRGDERNGFARLQAAGDLSEIVIRDADTNGAAFEFVILFDVSETIALIGEDGGQRNRDHSFGAL